ncbi:hypothetical protein AB8O64_10885 [Streptomyces sp. QH1-20]|uniref:hypothetical protein n=1 Tax=Streptomyces sp. QH1-20 TaxID=3240934 RepID=UPI0035120916
MSSTTIPLASEARAACGAYVRLHRRDIADILTDRLGSMEKHASARAQAPAWNEAARHLRAATEAIASASATGKDHRALRRTAAIMTLSAILAFEHAHLVSLPYDDHGRYHPAPGTEYPFSISDIGRAAVQLLGPDWHAESTPWGVGATIEHKDEPGAHFLLGVDEDGDLYVSANLRDESRTYLTDVCSAVGLPALAALVADTVHSIRDAD